MIGILIVTHSSLGDSLIEAAQFILGYKPKNILSVSININEDAEKLRKKIADGIHKANKGSGVLILTDMFGGSPSNLSYSFLEEGKIDVISGVNLPILIRAENARSDLKLNELSASVEAYGKQSIRLASGILRGNKSS